jgi:hypothetical protein
MSAMAIRLVSRRREGQPCLMHPTHLKKFALGLLGTFALGLTNLPAQDGSPPFPVSLGGQAATYKAGEPFAKVANPVKNNAAIEVSAKSDMTIINVN